MSAQTTATVPAPQAEPTPFAGPTPGPAHLPSRQSSQPP